MRHARLALDREAIELRPADGAAVRAQRQRLHDVAAPPDAAVENYRSAARHRLGDCGQRVQGGGGAVELAAAVVGDEHPVHAVGHRLDGVRRVKDALEQERPLPDGAQIGDVAPLHAGVGQPQHALGERGEVLAAVRPAVVAEGDVRDDVPHPEQPAQLGRHVEDFAGGHRGRNDEAVADVSLAVAEELGVDGHDQPFVAARRRALGHLLRQPAVLEDVGLEPEGPDAGLRQLFQAADRAVAEAVDGACLGRRPSRGGLAVGPQQPGKPRGRDDERHGEPPAEQRGREVAVQRAADRARIEGEVVEGGGIAAQRLLVARPAVDEVEDRARQHAPGPLPKRRDVVGPPLPAGLAFARHPRPRRDGATV